MSNSNSAAVRVFGRSFLLGMMLVLAVVTLAGWWWGWGREDDSEVVKIDGIPLRISAAKEGGGAVTISEKDISAKDQSAMMKMVQNSMRERVQAYAKMSTEEKKKHLDEQIDEQLKMMKDGGLKIGPTTMSSTQPSGTTIERGADGSIKQATVIRRSANDKSMMEEMDPELRAALAQYASDMRQRRAERGLPDGPGGISIVRTITLPSPPK